MLPSPLKGHIEVASAAILFGTIGIFVSLINRMPVGSIIFYRLLFGITAIAIFFACCGKGYGELRLKENKQYVILLGILQAGTMLSYFISVKHTTVAIAVLLLYTAPIYVTLLSPLLLKEPVTRRSLSALILSLSGVILVIQPGAVFQDMDSMYAIGLLCGLISGLLYACMILTSRYLKGCYTGTAQAAWAIIITMIIFLPYSTAVSSGVLLDNLHLLILLGLLPTAASLTLYFSGLMYVRAQNASIIALLEPASAVVFAAIILSQPITSSVLVGGGLILVGALVVSGVGAVGARA
ncbi:MAG: EamA family transporter [Candidatus Methanogaster sp.]|uniref:EamA family transporter n=1 Tax=Candidatus Methanogaster sp. TaxID=3386292 RepID=A0AC61KYL7_9EURY|nr:MAG: EamA family transporter [ANME-2 cluster archaeon]